MNRDRALRALGDQLRHELEHGILPYWLEHGPDQEHGGFVGLVSGDDVASAAAPKGAILNARILWTFSAAYRALRRGEYRCTAERAAAYLQGHFLDPEHGGAYWMLDAGGAPLDDRKHVYAQAFAIYGLVEYHRATGDEAALTAARQLYSLVERHAADAVRGGYLEAFSRDWTPLEDVRLSPDDPDERRSMNTPLHLLEAYTALSRVWPDPGLRERLHALIELFLDRIIDPESGHLHVFFDDDWVARSGEVAFGHDIEASWLLVEAAGEAGDAGLSARVRAASLRLAEAVLETGIDACGGIFEWGGAVTDTDKEWWPQAEAIVGFLNAYELTGRGPFLDATLRTWDFVSRHVVDAEHGEWFRRVARDGTPRPGHEKAGPWKCPYHNSRACLEVMARVERLHTR